MTGRVRRWPTPSPRAAPARTTALAASRALALAFAAGGGSRYLDAWIATVTAPLAAEPDHRPAVLAARIENILRSWRTLAETPTFPGLAPDVAALIEGGIGRHAGALAARVPSVGVSHAEATHALLVAGLAFDGAEGLAERAIAELDRGLAAGAWPDGGHRTGTLDEHRRAMRRYLAAVENARRFALHLPAGFLDRVGAVCDFVLHTAAVDGDSGRLTGNHDLLLAGEITRPRRPPLGRHRGPRRPPADAAQPVVPVRRRPRAAHRLGRRRRRRSPTSGGCCSTSHTLGASISTRIGEMLIAPEEERRRHLRDAHRPLADQRAGGRQRMAPPAARAAARRRLAAGRPRPAGRHRHVPVARDGDGAGRKPRHLGAARAGGRHRHRRQRPAGRDLGRRRRRDRGAARPCRRDRGADRAARRRHRRRHRSSR